MDEGEIARSWERAGAINSRENAAPCKCLIDGITCLYNKLPGPFKLVPVLLSIPA